jgi:capsid protein
MTTYDAAAPDRLLTDWSSYWSGALDAAVDWDREGLTLGQRAWKLVLNDPYATALMDAVVGNVLGTGLHFVPTYQLDAAAAVSPAELAVRAQITAAITGHSEGKRLDPGCALSRLDIEEQLIVSGFVAGDGFAIRTWSPGRPGCDGYATAWRVIDAARVCNPDNKPNVPGQLINGITLRDGVPYQLHVRNADQIKPTWTSVDWFAKDGSRNVIHYAPDRRRAGGVRGFSKFAPLLKLATHLARLSVAHVTGKRIQASHPMTIQSTDPKKAAEAHQAQARMGDNSAIRDATVVFVDKSSDVTMSQVNYNGGDFDQFVKTQLMAFCASWGYPWQFVLHQLTDTNLAAAQAALDQADRTTERLQAKVIADIEQPLDESILREAVARRTVPAAPIPALMAGSYERPRRADANRLRTRQAAELARKLGVSPSTVMAEMGYNLRDEILATEEDLRFAAAHGVDLTAADAPPAEVADPVDDPPGDDDPADDPLEPTDAPLSPDKAPAGAVPSAA